ncbi:MAG TPA: cytochrome b N-terminal domain-containing protein [Gaiellaceae bacterium]|nr:cytochrome b N-terminal domain-containing protein [Gaiellaceae bacterium]
MIRATVRFLDSRAGAAPLLKKALRYVFPDHWSFLLGEVALYSFLVLVATGVYLTFFFEPSTTQTIYDGSYAPLRGQQVSEAYRSVLDLSLERKAGLLIRQTHHWAADVFIVSIVLHLIRVFFTGAFRKPRDLVYYAGLGMLMLALLEGYIGYSLVDDLLSGMGLAIGYSVGMALPFVGANLMLAIFDGPFPGSSSFWPRMYVAHVLLLPLLIGGLLAVHLLGIVARHHTQFRAKPRQTERKVVGLPAFPGYAPRSIGLALAVAAVLFLLGGLVQINPVWLWGPYHVSQGTNGAQPDWYLGWLIGALRLMPSFDVTIGSYTLVPNPFWGGVGFPLAVFGLLAAWPWLERKVTRDRGAHNLLDRPRDAPWRTAIGVGILTWVFLVFLFGSSDRVYVFFGLSYEGQLWVYRVLVWVVPVVAAGIAHRVCVELRAGEHVERMRALAETEAARERALGPLGATEPPPGAPRPARRGP